MKLAGLSGAALGGALGGIVLPGAGMPLGAYIGHKMQSRKPGEKAGLGERAARVALNPVGYAAGKVLGAPATYGGKAIQQMASTDPSAMGKVMRGVGKWTEFTGSLVEPGSEAIYDMAEGFRPKQAFLTGFSSELRSILEWR